MPKNDVLICEVIKGIIVATTAVSKLRHTETLSSDYDQRDHYLLDADNTSLEFKDYAPNVFNYIRRNFLGLSEEAYLRHWRMPENLNLVESAGRKLKTMLSILRDYVRHFEMVNGHSFIMRVVGLHRLTYKSVRTWVLVFENSMPSSVVIDDELDLKGRMPKKGKSLKERGRYTPKFVAKKDNELDRGILFSKARDKKTYVTRLVRDVNFLESHNLMDYSLLVGIHYVRKEEQQGERVDAKGNGATTTKHRAGDPDIDRVVEARDSHNNEPSVVGVALCSVERALDLDGFLGINPKNGQQEIYFFGIIDCLTTYSAKKKTAFFFKNVLWNKSTLSTVNANYYGHRFATFMTKNLITGKEISYKLEIADLQQGSSVQKNEDSCLSEPARSQSDANVCLTLEESRSTYDEHPSLSAYIDRDFSYTRMAASTSA